MNLSIKPLQAAFLSLSKAMNRAKLNPLDLEVRDGCIQRFEYTYELSIKLIKRYLELEMPLSTAIDQLNFRDLIRMAFEVGLIDEVICWFDFREARNQTSHAYDERKAQAVFDIIPIFIQSAQFLLNQFDARLESNHDST